MKGDAERLRERVGPRTLLRNEKGGARCAQDGWTKSLSGCSCGTGRRLAYVNERPGRT